MDNNKTARKWSDVYGLNVTVPSEGKTLGQVEDFYFQEGTNAIYALSVRTRLHGDFSLPVSGIKSIEAERITLPNAQMLLRATPPFTRGTSLLERKVVGEDGNELGTIINVLLSNDSPSTLRVVGYEVTRGNSNHARIFTADGVAHYNDDDNTVMVYDHTARSLR